MLWSTELSGRGAHTAYPDDVFVTLTSAELGRKIVERIRRCWQWARDVLPR
jgi:hypothetical protein